METARGGEQRPAILVTGGAGYIGSHVCKALRLAGYRPVVYDNLSRGNRWALRWGPLEFHDLADHAAISRVVEKYAPKAANTSAGCARSVREVIRTFERVTGRNVLVRVGPRRDGDPPRLMADPARAMALLGWIPRLSMLDSIVETATAWHMRQEKQSEAVA